MLADGTAAELYRRGGGWIALSAAPRLAWVRRHRPELWAATSRLQHDRRLDGVPADRDTGHRGLDRLHVRSVRSRPPGLVPGAGGPGWAGRRLVPRGRQRRDGRGSRVRTGVQPDGPGRRHAGSGGRTGHGARPAPARDRRVRAGSRSPVGASGSRPWWRPRRSWNRPGGCARSAMSARASGWSRGSAGTPGSRCAGSGTAPARPAGYAELEELAAAVPPGARGLTARLARADAWTWARWQPPFPPRPDAPAAGLGEQARAIQEAAAYATRRAAGLVSELLGPGAGQQVTLTGGAARSRLWPQILADVLGCPVGVAEHTESAALGAAILAGRAAGVLPEDPPTGARPADAARPSLAGQRVYARLYSRWRSADQCS